MENISVLPDTKQLVAMVVEYVVNLAAEAVAQRGHFTIALSGGSTPRVLYEALATKPTADRIEWGKVHVFWGDERCVPPDHPDSNYRMAHEALLKHVPIPAENIYRMEGEANPPIEASIKYTKTLLRAEIFSKEERVGLAPRLDLVLLGMGDDGHTASIFPGTEVIFEKTDLVMAYYVAKLGVSRITLTPPAINAAAHVAFLVTGESKAEMLKNVLTGPYQPVTWPSQVIRPANGELVWFVDKAAASLLE